MKNKITISWEGNRVNIHSDELTDPADVCVMLTSALVHAAEAAEIPPERITTTLRMMFLSRQG